MRSASTLGAVRKKDSNAVSVALSRRRYHSECFLLIYCDKFQLRITPTANRNSYRVAILVGTLTQGSELRPQPWAGESQHLQRSYDMYPPTGTYSVAILVGLGNATPTELLLLADILIGRWRRF